MDRSISVFRYALLAAIGVLFPISGFTEKDGAAAGNETARIIRGVRRAILEKIEDPDFLFSKRCTIEGDTAEFDSLYPRVGRLEDGYVATAGFNAMNIFFDLNYYVKRREERFEVVKVTLYRKNGSLINRVLWEEQPRTEAAAPEKTLPEKTGGGNEDSAKGGGRTDASSPPKN